jgi:hypothetical protein
MNGCSCLHGELDFSNQTIIIFRIPKQPDAIHCSTTFFYCGIVTIAVDANVRSSKSGSVNAVLVDSKHMPFLEQAMHGILQIALQGLKAGRECQTVQSIQPGRGLLFHMRNQFLGYNII